MKNVIDFLEERGFIDQVTSQDVKKQESIKLYVGFDPTADSLHLGNLVPIILLKWFQKFGHTPCIILGGATGRIGDPSGKSIERPFLDDKIILENVFSIKCFLEKILGKDCIILNNNDWFKNISYIEFLRDVGKHFRLSTMLAKESVKLRLESEEGMSFTEFSYQMLQAYDFYYLFKNYGITLQIGGSEQWGNITAGIELVRKLISQTVYGLTFPLITRSDGKKFGKSEEGAIWLDSKKLSPYHFYQYLIKFPDKDVIKLMRMLTFLDLKEIDEIEKEMTSPNYIPNSAQKKLAEEITLFIHGRDGLDTALKVTKGAAPGSSAILSKEILESIALDMPHANFSFKEVIGQKFIDIAFKSGLASSKSEAARLISGGGAYLNNEKIEDQHYIFSKEDLIEEEFLLLGFGKKKKVLIKVFKNNF
jgi:tyrosyl-tRNA synthetase